MTTPLDRYQEGDEVYLCLDGGTRHFTVRERRAVGDGIELELEEYHSEYQGSRTITASWTNLDETGTYESCYADGSVERQSEIFDAAPEERMLMDARTTQLLKAGLSPAEALDYYHANRDEYSMSEWASERGISHQAVSENVRKARQKLQGGGLSDEID